MNLLLCGPQFYVKILLSPESLTIKIIEIRIEKNGSVLPKKKSTPVIAAVVSLAVQFIIRARVTYHNFAEVNFRDFLPTGTDLGIGTYDRSSYAS